MTERTMVEALNLGLRQEMAKDPTVHVLGEDVGVDGGVFRVTDELVDAFGCERVIDTPLAESGILGMGIGMALAGLRPVCEMQFSGFSYFGFHQLECHAARYRWRSRGGFPVPLVVRMPYGAGVHALEHHSESREAYFAHTPGLKTVIPSGPRAARGLLVSAIRDPDPVIFLEPKLRYRTIKEDVPDAEETLPIGRAEIVRAGDAVTIVTYGAMLHRVLEAAATMADEHDIDACVIDLRTLSPLDIATVVSSVEATHRVMVVHEAPGSFGPAAEVVTRVCEHCFYALAAPPVRITGPDTHVPLFAREERYLPSVATITQEACKLARREA